MKISIRVKTKHPDADDEPYKFLGHGWCNTVMRSITLNIATNDHRMIAKTCWNILIHQLKSIKLLLDLLVFIAKLNWDKIKNIDVVY